MMQKVHADVCYLCPSLFKSSCFAYSGWKMVILGELGSLQRLMWGWNQTEDTPLC